LPRWFHKGEVLGSHFAQLIVPFFLFAPQPIASIAALIIILTQLWLVFTGIFAWLHCITIVLAFSAVSDEVVRAVVPWVGFAGEQPVTPLWFVVVVLAVTALLVVVSWRPLAN